MADPSKHVQLTDPRVQAALRDYIDRIDRGEVENLEWRLTRRTEIAEALRSFFAADDLLVSKLGHRRAREIQDKYCGYGKGEPVRTDRLSRFTRPRNKRRWILWSTLAFALAVFAGMYALMVIYLGQTSIVVDVQDPNVTVGIKGSAIAVTGPGREAIRVEPGEQELTIRRGDRQFVTKSFTVKKGETKTLKISVVDKNVVVLLDGERISLGPRDEAGSARHSSL